jgi:hypothetical protein
LERGHRVRSERKTGKVVDQNSVMLHELMSMNKTCPHGFSVRAAAQRGQALPDRVIAVETAAPPLKSKMIDMVPSKFTH